MHFEIKLWSVILVFLAIPFCLVATESTGEELWYDASGEVVKRVKQMGKGSKHAGEPIDWEPAWVIRERFAMTRSEKRCTYKRPQYRHGLALWYCFGYDFWNRVSITGMKGRTLVWPGKSNSWKGLHFGGERFYR
ncbi:MAG TPA: hypothetical protein DIV39_09670 [Verrucomicrobiales bacterium]|nr:hypothetical protein [Verrucomicrobiales bacterium]